MSGAPAGPPPPPPPTLHPSDAGDRVAPARTPRPGELTPAWRLVTAVAWIAVAVAMAAVWKTSDQLGLSTWWLGPRGDPQPRVVQLLPFVPSVAMVLAASNNARWLPVAGIAASACLLGVGLGDLTTFDRLAVIEIAIAGAGALVSIASTTGTYRRVNGDADAVTEAR